MFYFNLQNETKQKSVICDGNGNMLMISILQIVSIYISMEWTENASSNFSPHLGKVQMVMAPKVTG